MEIIPRAGRWLYMRAADSVPDFVARYAPSMTTDDVAPWICAQREFEEWEPPMANPKMVEEFERKVTPRMSSDSKAQLDMLSVAPLFKKYNYVLGKWVMFAARDDVDEMWAGVVHEVMNEGLGCGIAKVSTVTTSMPEHANPEFFDPTVHVICIYTLDFTEHWDVKLNARKIRALGYDGMLKYKPEAATQLDLYVGNERWGDRPTSIYVQIPYRQNVTIDRRHFQMKRDFCSVLYETRVFSQM